MQRVAIIKKKLWKWILTNAKKSYPNECTGILVGQIGDLKRIKGFIIVDVIPCKNVADEKRNSSRIAKIEERRATKIIKEERKIYGKLIRGHYHSHPYTGCPFISDTDRRTGVKIKRYQYQIIVGIKKHKNKFVIKSCFWWLEDKIWYQCKINVS